MGLIVRKCAALSVASVIASCAESPVFGQQSVEQFYKGRTITLLVQSSPGGINDIAARLVSRHLGALISGHPTIIVQNIPGGEGLVLVNRIYNTAERDGSVISIIGRATPQLAIQGNPNALFDPLKMTWLGSLSSYTTDAYLLVVNASHPAKSVADLRNPGISAKIGGVKPGSTNLTFAIIAKQVLGLNIDVIRGYPGAAAMFLAMQRGELDGQIVGYNSIRAGQPHLWNDKLVRTLIQFGHDTRLGNFTDIPTGQELTTDPDGKALVQFAELPFPMALPFAAPPGLPPDRAQALQTAFVAMTQEKSFLEDAAKVDLDISAIDGSAVRDVIARAAATPKEVISRYNEMVSTGR